MKDSTADFKRKLPVHQLLEMKIYLISEKYYKVKVKVTVPQDCIKAKGTSLL